ncbi:MAG: hypothetical protein U5L10_03160 [Candidatus Moranbacteria bacterium]|nr:hypothetical protein [Candidatus Moranbacteria bacterium]
MNQKEELKSKILQSTLAKDDKELWATFLYYIDEEKASAINEALETEDDIQAANKNFQDKLWAARMEDTEKMKQILEDEKDFFRNL